MRRFPHISFSLTLVPELSDDIAPIRIRISLRFSSFQPLPPYIQATPSVLLKCVHSTSFFLPFFSYFFIFSLLLLTCVFPLISFLLLPACASSPDSTVCCMSLPLRASAALHSQTGSQPSQWDTHFGAAARTAGDVCVFMRACAGSVLLCLNVLACSRVKEKAAETSGQFQVYFLSNYHHQNKNHRSLPNCHFFPASVSVAT